MKFPKVPFKILRFFCKPWYVETIEGDLHELFYRSAKAYPLRAQVALYWNVIRFFRWRYLKDLEDFKPQSSIGMLKTYFKVSFRSMTRHKLQSTLNVLGLAVGITCCLLMLMHVKHELKYDQHITDADRVFRVTLNNGGPYTPPRLVKQMRLDYPEVETGVRVRGSFESVVKIGTQYLTLDKGLMADSTFFEVFPNTFLSGNPETALTGVNDIVLTESLVERLFEGEEVIGKVMDIEGTDYTVTAVVKDPPETTSVPYAFIVSIPVSFWTTTGYWTGNSFFSYLKLKEGVNTKNLETKFLSFVERHIWPELHESYPQYATIDEYFGDGHSHFFRLIPLLDIHLHHPRLSLGVPGDYVRLATFSAVSLFILLIACINYVNMSTARASLRAKEIGMRKVLGSLQHLIAQQFLVEAFLITLGAVLLGIILAVMVLPYFNHIVETTYQFSDLMTWTNLGWFVLILLLTSFLSGIYPALYLSSFKPTAALKGEMVMSGSKGVRSGLVVFQFAISLFLLIATFIVHQQIHLMTNRKLGLEAEQVYVLKEGSKLDEQFQTFKNELMAHPGIENVAISDSYPSGFIADWNYQTTGEGPIKFGPYNLFVSADVADVWGLKVTQGRFFESDRPLDSAHIVVNEALCEHLGWEQPIGQMLSRGPDEVYRVIGVVENFSTGSAKRENRPVLMRYLDTNVKSDFGRSYITVKMNGDIIRTVNHLEATWDKFFPGFPMNGLFLDDSFQRLYEGEERFGLLFSGFSALAIIIACIGLFTLSSFVLERKKKEIALRKVMGAQVHQIFVHVSKYFVKLMLISAAVATPIAFYLGNSWLENYVERIDLGVLIFLIPVMALFALSLITIAYQTIKTASENPVIALKEE